MTTEPKKLESGAAGKPGESTAAEKVTLSVNGMADLLKSEFSSPAATPEPEAGQEIPPASDDSGGPADGDQPTPKDESVVVVEDEDEDEKPTPEAESLPGELKSALDEWEEAGGPLPEPLQKLVDKRIGKLTGARNAEKARADKAEAELTAARAEAEALRNDPARPAVTPAASLPDEKALNAVAATGEKFLAEAENYLDDTATYEEQARVERYMASERLDANGLKRRVREVNRYVTQELPKQVAAVQAFKAEERTVEPIARERFGWLEDKAHPEFQRAQSVLNVMPELRSRTPAHKIALGTYVVGLRVMDALNAAGVTGDVLAALDPILAKNLPAKGTAAPAKAKTPPPKAPTGSSAAPSKSKAPRDEAARQSFNQNPTRSNATELARAALMAA